MRRNANFIRHESKQKRIRFAPGTASQGNFYLADAHLCRAADPDGRSLVLPFSRAAESDRSISTDAGAINPVWIAFPAAAGSGHSLDASILGVLRVDLACLSQIGSPSDKPEAVLPHRIH